MGKIDINFTIDFILKSIDLIEKRFSGIDSGEDFLKNDKNLEKFDSISMRLQTIGENIKNLYKNNPEVLENFATKDYWSSIMKMREIISHHYINIDACIFRLDRARCPL
ncbi:HepT-like ribonuclease domain-containing protein [Flexistipes sp.]|uniref:HepT-like ribonuclease domain-containing protein n=1 Tax=Flexistipes sp. TaxID=3088135 RepID=UPI002E1F239B|nr:HepT-like ribonuclease domain-containing protein [Flexistipes sp.]